MTRLSCPLSRLLALLSCAAALLPSVLAQSFVAYQGFMPISLTFDSAGRLWVLDQASFALLQLSPTTGAEISRVDVSQLSPQMECPNVLRIDAQGRCFIADGCNNLIYVLSSTGVQLPSLTTSNPGLSFPEGLALGSDGSVYIGDEGNMRVVKLNSAGQEVADFYDQLWGEWNGGQLSPGAIALDAAGTLYVCDWDSFVVIAFDQQGGQKALYNVSLTAHALQAGERYQWVPLAVAVAADNTLWVANILDDWISGPGFSAELSFNSFITQFAANGSVLQQFNTSDATRPDSGSWAGIAEPNDMAFDSAGNLWLADTWNGRVLKYSSSGKQLGSYNLGALPLVEPFGVAVDGSGTMFIADAGLPGVIKLSATGQVLGKFSVSGINFWPTAIALGSDGSMYLSDEDNSRALKLSPQGALLQIFNTTRPPLSNWVRGLALDQDFNLLLCDAELNRVVLFSPNGTHLYSYTASMELPADVAVGADGSVYVVDEMKERVVKIAKNGTKLTTFTTSNPALSYPTGIIVDATTGNLFVADAGNGRIVILSPAGALLAVIGSPNTPMCPEHMTLSAKGDLYVADECGDRIIIFQLSTSPPHWIVPAATPSSSSSSGVSGGALAGLIVGCVLGGALLSCVVLSALWCACRGDWEGKRTGSVKAGGSGALQFKRQSDDDEADSSHAASQVVEMS